MIYVSSSCVRAATIGEAVQKLAEQGYQNIELSGGTQPYSELESDLLRLKKEYNLNYLCHNYFPPPPRPFVVNLASLNAEISDLSVQHLTRSIALSKTLGAKKFGFHAGFLMDIPLNQIGQSIAKQDLFGRDAAYAKFVENLAHLKSIAGDVQLYVENNVVSEVNMKNYHGANPLLVTDAEGCEEMSSSSGLPVLLDVAHLKVSCKTLGLNFPEQLSLLISSTDYIHISDNDGRSDSNSTFEEKSELWEQLSRHNLNGKTITLEVYAGADQLKSSVAAVKSLS